MQKLPHPKAILFDFDGTLADTAPDLVEATQRLLRMRGLAEKPYEQLRQVCSSGARGLLDVAFGLNKDSKDKRGQDAYEPMRQAFLQAYRDCLTQNTRLFAGVFEVLSALNAKGIAWGIVTNKATDLTNPIVQALLTQIGLTPATVVCGDTTPHPKPHPAPLLLACEQVNCEPHECWYVGDDRRDIACAIAAACIPIAVSFGYHPEHDPPHTWGARCVIAQPSELVHLLSA